MKPHSRTARAAQARSHQHPRSSCAVKVKIPAFILPALRSDHAGEAGAVEIYIGRLWSFMVAQASGAGVALAKRF